MIKQQAVRFRSNRFKASKHMATLAAVVLTTMFVVVFFASRTESRQLTDVAPRAGMSSDELLAIGPRIASQSGVTLGSSRRVVYLLACSGLASKDNLEARALQAGTLAKSRRLTDREAVATVLTVHGAASGVESIKDC